VRGEGNLSDVPESGAVDVGQGVPYVAADGGKLLRAWKRYRVLGKLGLA
jgi:hypothetical protein